MNLVNNQKIYFIGIGGIAMSAVAGIAKELGYVVSGSDSKAIYNPAKAVLDDMFIPYHIGYDAAHIIDDHETLFIASAGEDETNPEVAEVIKQGGEIYSFSQLLRTLFADQLRIVVTGTHGKSTTSAMLGTILRELDDSSFVTGAVLVNTNKNYYLGDGHYVVFEGDEYKSLYNDPTPKFVQYQPDILLLTNLEFDHPDIFDSLEEIENELAELIHRMPNDGLVVYNADNIALTKLAHQTSLGTISFALNNSADFVASNIQTTADHTIFDVQKSGDFPKESYIINSFGEMNVYNALGPIALLRTLGFSQEKIQEGLDQYLGIKRRFEYVGKYNEAKIFDDYAHHPTAIRETLATARLRFPQSKIWAVFEPHTFSRTQAVLSELATSFNGADQILIAEVYPAREMKQSTSITGQDVVEQISKHNSNVRLVSSQVEAQEILQAELNPTDIVLVMAVGDFNTLALKLTTQNAD